MQIFYFIIQTNPKSRYEVKKFIKSRYVPIILEIKRCKNNKTFNMGEK